MCDEPSANPSKQPIDSAVLAASLSSSLVVFMRLSIPSLNTPAHAEEPQHAGLGHRPVLEVDHAEETFTRRYVEWRHGVRAAVSFGTWVLWPCHNSIDVGFDGNHESGLNCQKLGYDLPGGSSPLIHALLLGLSKTSAGAIKLLPILHPTIPTSFTIRPIATQRAIIARYILLRVQQTIASSRLPTSAYHRANRVD